MYQFTTDLWKYLSSESSKGRPVVLYGTGDGADKIIRRLDDHSVPVSGIFASPGFVRNRTFHDLKVESFEDCYERFGPSMIVLMCFGSSRPEVLSYVDLIKGKCELYAPDVPVYGDNLFDLKFYNDHIGELLQVRDLLEDRKSVETFDEVIAARITGDIDHLKKCEVTQSEADSLLPSSMSGLYIDLGAYNGDTVQRYCSIKGLTGIIAVEPDRRNMRKLRENTSSLSSLIPIEYIHAFISDKDGFAYTDKNLGRGTSIDKPGLTQIDTVTIDGLSRRREVSFIKFDVEGAESSAIEGGAETIRAFKPSMNIACYHRSEDLFRLPLKVLQINPGYKVYMRHTASIPAWDTYFYFC